MASKWMRWNETSHIFEYSTNEGVSYIPLPLNASILNEGTLNPAVTPAGGGIPTGVITAFGGATAPTGYLLCNGAAVSRTTYAALFAIISTLYGVGDNSTTFNLPDLQQKFPLGKAASGTGATLGGVGGTIDHIHSAPIHNHSTPAHTHTITATAAASAAVQNMQQPVGNPLAINTSAHTHAITGSADSGGASTSGNNAAANTGTGNPPFQVVNYIIKT